MRAVPARWSFFAVLALVAGSVACTQSTPQAAPTQASELRSGPAQLEIVIGQLTASSEEIKSDGRVDYGILDIRNDLDRSISIDFVGAGHFDMTVGDKRAKRVRLGAGTYTMAVGAPGMTPGKAQITIDASTVYSLTIFQRR